MSRAVLAPFAGLCSATVWEHAQVLVIGAILCQGPPTVAAARRVRGLGQEPRVERYHRVLNRARWSGLQAAKLLLGLGMQLLPAHGMPVRVVADPVERRRGKRSKAKGCYREAVRSTGTPVVKGLGLKGRSLLVGVRLPWGSRPWALPGLTVLAPAERAHQQAKKRHQTPGDWTGPVVKVVSRWVRRPGVLLGDGALACRRLGWTCVQPPVVWISRWRLEAQLYDVPTLPVRPRRGPKPRQGVRLPAWRDRVAAAQRSGEEVELYGEGGERRRVRRLRGVARW